MNNLCLYIHQLFNNLPRHFFPYRIDGIPSNGIYILFEKGEYTHSCDRIVRIGTHTGKNQLLSRLNQHFIKENKDRSIFRKNIGRAILSRDDDLFLSQWNWDLTKKALRDLYLPQLDSEKQFKIEKIVAEYIQNHFSFVVFEVIDKRKRLQFESKIISTVSLCKDCYPSNNWLGLFSPINKIKESGLWQVNELYKTPLNEEDIKGIQKFCNIG